MRVTTQKRHQLFGHTGFEPVDIAHADTCIATDMLKAPTALADDGRGDKFGMVFIDLCLPFLTVAVVITEFLGRLTITVGGDQLKDFGKRHNDRIGFLPTTMKARL